MCKNFTSESNIETPTLHSEAVILLLHFWGTHKVHYGAMGPQKYCYLESNRLHIHHTLLRLTSVIIIPRRHVPLIGRTVSRRWRFRQICIRWLRIVASWTRNTRNRRTGTEPGRRIPHVVRHVGLGDLLERQQRVTGHKVVVSRHEYGREDGALHSFVVIRVDAHLFLFGRERILAVLQGF